MENPPFWWYLPGKMGVFMGYVSLREGRAFFIRAFFSKTNGLFLTGGNSTDSRAATRLVVNPIRWRWKLGENFYSHEKRTNESMVGMLVPLKGGLGGIVHPPIGRKNTTYIPLIVLAFWGVICYRSHLLGEPETTIEWRCTLPKNYPKDPQGPSNGGIGTCIAGVYRFSK